MASWCKYVPPSMCVRRGAISVTMYNFGSPRVGNKKFAEVYNKVTNICSCRLVVSKFSTTRLICLYIYKLFCKCPSFPLCSYIYFSRHFRKKFLLLVNLWKNYMCIWERNKHNTNIQLIRRANSTRTFVDLTKLELWYYVRSLIAENGWSC